MALTIAPILAPILALTLALSLALSLALVLLGALGTSLLFTSGSWLFNLLSRFDRFLTRLGFGTYSAGFITWLERRHAQARRMRKRKDLSRRVVLREVQREDLDAFFALQQDPEASRMAAFTTEAPADRAVFDAKWEKTFADPGITMRAIVVDGRVAGNVMCHGWFGAPEIVYWIDREFWGQGIATFALEEFLGAVSARPLFAHAAHDNLASIRVLEKSGFVKTGETKSFARARRCEIAEVIYRLDGREGKNP